MSELRENLLKEISKLVGVDVESYKNHRYIRLQTCEDNWKKELVDIKSLMPEIQKGVPNDGSAIHWIQKLEIIMENMTFEDCSYIHYYFMETIEDQKNKTVVGSLMMRIMLQKVSNFDEAIEFRDLMYEYKVERGRWIEKIIGFLSKNFKNINDLTRWFYKAQIYDLGQEPDTISESEVVINHMLKMVVEVRGIKIW